ncbi:hypothetical protein EVAR_100195_1 [Eumeta japonica]|uniref:Uncharacterized protein n=1 Tax=Eumeta variegata TaxID=151549 RepID=A0A4C2ABF9_EUMVA|nr:hypothetical protein EVAR_100195_1 [Eumeta japonica]
MPRPPPRAAAAPLRAMKDSLQISADSSRDRAHRVSQQVLSLHTALPVHGDRPPHPPVPPRSQFCPLPTDLIYQLFKKKTPISQIPEASAVPRTQNGRRASILIADYSPRHGVRARSLRAPRRRGHGAPHQSIAHVPRLIFSERCDGGAVARDKMAAAVPGATFGRV